MKKNIYKIVLVAICCFIYATISNAQSTTCDLTLDGTNYHGMTYKVSFEVYDAYNGLPGTMVEGPSLPPATCSWGFNDDFNVPLGVDEDNDERYYLKAIVTRFYYGTPAGSSSGTSDTGDLMSSEEYYAGDIPVTVSF